jgi:site-specific DNA-methyltransferase (adenine-specific)
MALSENELKGMLSSEFFEWETPRDRFDQWNAVFNFDLDAAANSGNTLCRKYLSLKPETLKWVNRAGKLRRELRDCKKLGNYHAMVCIKADLEDLEAMIEATGDSGALGCRWLGKSAFCNPPYGSGVINWVRKGCFEAHRPDGPIVVMLLAARTETEWFQEYLFGTLYRDCERSYRGDPSGHAADLIFLNERVRFVHPEEPELNQPAFPSVLAVFGSKSFDFALASRFGAFHFPPNSRIVDSYRKNYHS